MGPISRAQIARHSDLSKPTVSQALAALLDANLVREAGRTTGSRGPAAVLYELNPTAGWVVGIDVGRDYVRAAIANLSGNIVARRDERARVRSRRTLIEQIGAIAGSIAAEAGVKWRQVTFATIGSPGVFDPETGQVALAHALPGWGRHGLVDAVQAELGTKITFENDVNLEALGERWLGLGKGVEDFVYLHVGTGVGAGMVVRGELYRGATGAAGEVGYLPVAGDPKDPERRRRGALDTEAGATGVVAVARSLGMKPPLTARSVFAAARKGDVTAAKVVRIEAERIALANHYRAVAAAEHASVASFARVSLQLMALGAPADLVASAHAAALDEVEHARMTFALASSYSGFEEGPGALPVDALEVPALELHALALATFLDACVGETVGTVVAKESAEKARDPRVREVLARIASDEERHAALAWRTLAWAVRAGGDRVHRAMAEALIRLDEALPPLPERELDLTAHGVLTPDQEQAVRRRAIEEIVVPCARALIESRAAGRRQHPERLP